MDPLSVALFANICFHSVACRFFFFFLLEYSCFLGLLVSCLHHGDSATRTHVSFLLWASSPFRSLQSPEQRPLCWTRVLMSHPHYTRWCVFIKSSLPQPACSHLFSTSVFLSALQISSREPLFYIPPIGDTIRCFSSLCTTILGPSMSLQTE